MKKFPYLRSDHFKIQLRLLCQDVPISDLVLDVVRKDMHDQQLNIKEISIEKIRQILKHNGLLTYKDETFAVYNKLLELPLPNLNTEIKLKDMVLVIPEKIPEDY